MMNVATNSTLGWNHETPAIAFLGTRRIAEGRLNDVAISAQAAIEREPGAGAFLVFDALTSQPIELDLRGTRDEIVARIPPAPPATEVGAVAIESEAGRGPGRPKLGVVAREITLLPRQWDWLNGQPGGASVALRKLVDIARREGEGADKKRRAQESTFRFISAIGGNLPEFDEVNRALFAGDRGKLASLLAAWPADVRDHALKLAEPALA